MFTTHSKKIVMLGAGTWGIALARMLSDTNHSVTVWSALPDEIAVLSSERIHPKLPEMKIPDAVRFTADISVCDSADIVVFAVPSVFVRSTARLASPHIRPGQVIADVAKGLEPDTFYTMTEVIDEELKNADVTGIPVVALSGPTHAEEVAIDLPTTIVAASIDYAAAERIQSVFSSSFLRVYTNSDIRGVELCGALKNIIALAAGISDGLGYGDNAKAALITRGMAEIARLGISIGCNERTFYGLAGVGDLIVTATSRHSRNNRAGNLIGRGYSPDDAVKEVGMVVEGINAIPAAVAFAKQKHIETPIISAVDAVVNHGADPLEAVNSLLGRDPKDESYYMNLLP